MAGIPALYRSVANPPHVIDVMFDASSSDENVSSDLEDLTRAIRTQSRIGEGKRIEEDIIAQLILHLNIVGGWDRTRQ